MTEELLPPRLTSIEWHSVGDPPGQHMRVCLGDYQVDIKRTGPDEVAYWFRQGSVTWRQGRGRLAMSHVMDQANRWLRGGTVSLPDQPEVTIVSEELGEKPQTKRRRTR